MTPKEEAIFDRMRRSAILLGSSLDTLKYLSFEKLTFPGVARCTDIEANVGFVLGTLELLLGDLETETFPFREYQVSVPERQGSRT